jgi:uncharacterized protein
MRRSLDSAKLGHTEKVDGMRRLDRFALLVENTGTPQADFDAAIAHERDISPSLGGRMVDRVSRKASPKSPSQLPLF